MEAGVGKVHRPDSAVTKIGKLEQSIAINSMVPLVSSQLRLAGMAKLLGASIQQKEINSRHSNTFLFVVFADGMSSFLL